MRAAPVGLLHRTREKDPAAERVSPMRSVALVAISWA